jgi:hypothetical protein
VSTRAIVVANGTHHHLGGEHRGIHRRRSRVASLARANSVRRVVGRTRCGVSFKPEATRGARRARLNRRGDIGGDIGGEVRTVLSSINQCVGVFLHACGDAITAGIYFKSSSRIWASSAATRVSVEIRSRWT